MQAKGERHDCEAARSTIPVNVSSKEGCKVAAIQGGGSEGSLPGKTHLDLSVLHGALPGTV